MLPNRLQYGDEIRIIAPSTSGTVVKKEQIELAKERLENLGFKVTFSKNLFEYNLLYQSSIQQRIDDIHEAFEDKNVKMVLTILGGFSSNQLLKYIDYDLIKRNPKIICGYSDITALANAIHRKTGMLTYCGPHFSTFGMKYGIDYTRDYFLQTVTNDCLIEVQPSEEWSNDSWYLNQEDRIFNKNDGYFIINEGEATGTAIGGNLCTLNLLQGTEYMPSLSNSILFLEDDEETHARTFERDLQSLLHLPDANAIKAIVIGRFENISQMTNDAIELIIRSKEELKHIPVIANADFGHTSPMFTIPIGATTFIKAKDGQVEITFKQG